MIEVKGLTKTYGTRSGIQNINFKIPKGQIVGLLGPNGAGKTTTMKIITGCMSATDGNVFIDGVNMVDAPLMAKKKIGYLPEIPPLYQDMLVEDYLFFVAQLKQVPAAEIEKSVLSALEKTNLNDVKGRQIQFLSKGYKQRVGIAQALVNDPEILILDEPTVGLDPKQVHEVRELIKSLKGQHTVILSTHILSEVQASCDEVIIINKGEIVTQNTIDKIMSMGASGQQIELKVLRGEETLEDKLQHIEGVSAVQRNGQHFTMTLPPGSENTVEQVSKLVVEAGCGLVALKTVQKNLEDIFIGLTGTPESKGSVE